ncbi:MAG: hypothetical protein GF405_08120, partial [Candidatus Eisenbacteria bacterium]|nr:hypothetical protein [Candidatus Eisenbacteria bacterium]
MKNRERTIVALVLVLTAVSGVVAVRSLTSSVVRMQAAGSLATDSPGNLEIRGEEVTGLMTTLASASEVELENEELRDPMVPYKVKIQRTTPTTTAAPARPRYVATAVILDDEDPTAILRSGGQSMIVHLGDELDGGRVTAIEADG